MRIPRYMSLLFNSHGSVTFLQSARQEFQSDCRWAASLLSPRAMDGRMIDMAVVGGGLAGGLVALAVRRAHPELNIAIFEAGESLGGNHRWSWFASDLDAPGTQLMAGFATTGGPAATMSLPGHTRHRLRPIVRSPAGISMPRCAANCPQPPSARRHARQTGCRRRHAASGEHIAARCVIIAAISPLGPLRGGWQVFVGRHLRTRTAHGVADPIVMTRAWPSTGPTASSTPCR